MTASERRWSCTILTGATPGSPVEPEVWRDRVVAVRRNDIRVETVDVPTVAFGAAIGVALVGFGRALLGIGIRVVEREPLGPAAVEAALGKGFAVIVAGRLPMRDPLHESLLA
ncbi:hypothetical protein [Nocardia sp. NPDC052112]|uniref:hypothetical protein n=1 Tax=Nocardia sp. NPDC052112 TaxID=3155646 RepID=UPI0034449B7D